MKEFLLLATAHFLALLSPGPDFFIIISNTIKNGKLHGVFSSFGIAIANLVYILLALLGISFIKENPFIYEGIKILGAFYLIYIGFLLFRAKKRDIFEAKINKQSKTYLSSFYLGFLSAILNPKNSIFYLTIFSIAINQESTIFIQSFYTLWMFLIVLFWDIFIVYIISSKKLKKFLDEYLNTIEKVSGLIIFFIGFSIVISEFL